MINYQYLLMVGGNKAALMRELLKCMLRIFIAEHILYEFSIFITFFLDGLILPQYQIVLPCGWHAALQIWTLLFLY